MDMERRSKRVRGKVEGEGEGGLERVLMAGRRRGGREVGGRRERCVRAKWWIE